MKYPVRASVPEMQDFFDVADAVAGHVGEVRDRGRWQSLAGSLRSADFDEFRRSFKVVFGLPADTQPDDAKRQLNRMAVEALAIVEAGQ